jgi:tetratricopeptide (TPR) repeat protein
MPSAASLTASEEAQLTQTIEMFEVITQSQPQDYQSLEILKEAYSKLGREKELLETSKRIAKAYVQMGQLSSAILEYESILQRCPEDAETLAGLQEIESKATSLSGQENLEPIEAPKPESQKAKPSGKRQTPADIDDGRESMHKIFVDGKVLSTHDFEAHWVKQDWSHPPLRPVEPFIQILADKGLVPSEKSLKVISDKVRLGYLPLDRYDIDIELARSFPAEPCLRWCIIPFDRMSKSVLVATANPFNRQAAADLEDTVKQRILWYLAPPTDIIKALQKVFR